MEYTSEQKTLLATSKVLEFLNLEIIGLGKTRVELIFKDNENKHFIVGLNSGNCKEIILEVPIKTEASKRIEGLIKEQLLHE
jgi:hypothetical protein